MLPFKSQRRTIIHKNRIKNKKEISNFYESIVEARERGEKLNRLKLLYMLNQNLPSRRGKSYSSNISWLGYFCRKYRICRRRITIKLNSTKKAETLDQEKSLFKKRVRDVIQEYSITSSRILNIDETSLLVCGEGPYTLELKGTPRVYSKSKLTNDKKRITVLLGITKSGEKLMPYCIFKGKPKKTLFKTLSKTSCLRSGKIRIDVQPKAWMNTASLLNWCRLVYKDFHLTQNSVKLLIMDGAKPHVSAEVIDSLDKMKTKVIIIPPDQTSRLQPLDNMVIRQFKQNYRRNYYEDFLKNPNQKKLSNKNILELIIKSWGEVKKITIIKAFKIVQ